MLRFVAIRRFNYIDAVFNGLTAIAVVDGSYWFAAGFFVVGLVASVTAEYFA